MVVNLFYNNRQIVNFQILDFGLCQFVDYNQMFFQEICVRGSEVIHLDVRTNPFFRCIESEFIPNSMKFSPLNFEFASVLSRYIFIHVEDS